MKSIQLLFSYLWDQAWLATRLFIVSLDIIIYFPWAWYAYSAHTLFALPFLGATYVGLMLLTWTAFGLTWLEFLINCFGALRADDLLPQPQAARLSVGVALAIASIYFISPLSKPPSLISNGWWNNQHIVIAAYPIQGTRASHTVFYTYDPQTIWCIRMLEWLTVPEGS